EPGFPKFKGAISVVVPDHAGGWFVGGLFTDVGGYPLTNLAHITVGRTVDPTWSPNPDGIVQALVASPDVLYVGGAFTTLGGQARSQLGALDLATGQPTPWNVDVTGFNGSLPSVTSLALSEFDG